MKDSSEKFWDKNAERYAKRQISDEEAYQKKLQVSREYFQPEMEVLEFGCGTGSIAIEQAAFVKNIHAIDISSKMLEIAAKKVKEKGIQNIKFEQAGIDELKCADNSLDAVMGFSILHLLENKEETITKVYKMLKPSGVFITSTVCLGDAKKWMQAIAALGKKLGLLPNVKVFTVKNLQDCLKNTGFGMEHQWQPGNGLTVFMVAKKVDIE